MYQLIEDPGHSWLRVPADDIADIGVLDKITGFSYIHPQRRMVYLEEDEDMRTFMKRRKTIGLPVNLDECDYRFVKRFPDHPDIIQGRFVEIKEEEDRARDWIYPVKRLVTNENVFNWCKIPYEGHKTGCPNFGVADKCPPKAVAVKDYFDVSKPLYLVHSEYYLANHILEMEKKHPDWTLRQCKCVLYWQSTSRKFLRERINEAAKILGTNAMSEIPEAMGVNVYATARLAGLKLERIRHMEICRHVALIGHSFFGQMGLFD